MQQEFSVYDRAGVLYIHLILQSEQLFIFLISTTQTKQIDWLYLHLYDER